MDRQEAIKVIKDNWPEGRVMLKEALETLVPELNESEDEKIRKEILNVIHQLDDNTTICGRNYDFQKWIAWLEKQVEPTDKGEISDGYHTFNELYYYRMLYNAAFFNLLPKEWVHKSKRHHTGEECFGGGWFIVMAQLPTGQISNHYELKDWDLFHVQEKEIADEWDGHSPQEAADRLHKYLLEKQGEQNPTVKTDPKFNSVAKLWTIQDAKDGDVLTTHISPEGDWIGMYKQSTDDTFNTYCFLNAIGEFVVNPNRCKNHGTHGLHPATKEQRDLLFSKMKEAGYEWDYEKKELKKIKQNPTNKTEPKFKIEKGQWYVCIQSFILNGNTVVIEGRTYKSQEDNAISGEDTRLFIDKLDGDASEYFRLWTIQDAKDGDVLADNCSIIIFRKLGNRRWDDVIDYYIGYSCSSDKIKIQSGDLHYGLISKKLFKPATKEQRDLLFAKIKEAGYEWDAEKKELKKVEQNPAWSEEDEKISNAIWQSIDFLCIESCGSSEDEVCDWLKSIKKRMKGE
jgi:hypothetical protein